MLAGGCRCGAVRYSVDVEEPNRHGLCHCEDCRRSSGAPAVAWLAVPEQAFQVTAGEAKRWQGAGSAMRHFCAECGTGLYYLNDVVMPGIVDVQSVTLDDPTPFVPAVQIQCAERLEWMTRLNEMPEFERFPAG